MPRGDGTGPRRMGARSGRGAGFCAGYNQPGFAHRGGFGGGCGFGGGFGGGRGRRNQFYATGQFGWQRGAFGQTVNAAPSALSDEALAARERVLEEELAEVRRCRAESAQVDQE